MSLEKSYYEGSAYDMHEIDELVRAADPLGLDSSFSNELPRLNTARDIEGIQAFAKHIGFDPNEVDKLEKVDALAASRDLSMIAASLKRHNLDFSLCHGLEGSLVACSHTTGEIPADTVYSYANRNPQGRRMRTFTTHPQEGTFVSCTQTAMTHVLRTVAYLDQAQEVGLGDSRFTPLVQEAATQFAMIFPGMHEVFKSLPPEFFTNELRPFFDPKMINGKQYQAAGGAQMPIVLIDAILWGADSSDKSYRVYMEENVSYQTPTIRDRAKTILTRPSMRTQLLDLAEHGERYGEALTVVDGLLSHMLKFRKPHIRIAQKNMDVRPAGSVGSGGYTPHILQYLIDKTEEMRAFIAQKLQ